MVTLETLFSNERCPLDVRNALAEADRCLNCGGPLSLPPCVAACPASVDVPKFIRELRDQRPLDAAETIFHSNILGGTCARVCPVEELCQGACSLEREGRRSVAIAQLQRFATDAWFEEREKSRLNGERRGLDPAQEELATDTDDRRTRNGVPPPLRLSVGVIGAGPAGLSCAAELARLGHSVVIYEQRKTPGGLVTSAIAPYKQNEEPIPREVEAIRELGVEFRFGVGIDKSMIPALEDEHDALFLAVGLGPDWQVDVPGQDLKGVWESLPFIERLKRGVFKKLDGRIAVIGGGNTAIDVAREAALLGADDVVVIYRRTEELMPAYRHEVVAAREEGVRFLWLTAPVRFIGSWNVKAIECIRMELTGKDASGRPRPEPAPGSEFQLNVDMVITALGQQPRKELLDAFGVELRKGLVVIDENGRTSNPRRFAGGDCTNGGATVVQAVQHGKRAAFAMHEQLAGAEGFTAHMPWAAPRWQGVDEGSVPVGVERDNGTLRHYQGDFAISMRADRCKGCPLCIRSCPAGMLELDASQRIRMIDISQCIFCGLCEERCPEFAIWMERGSEGSIFNRTRAEHATP